MRQRVVAAVAAMLLAAWCGRWAFALPWLRADGTRIVDARGKTLVLRGINLGGWLVEEMWMMPFETEPPAGSGFQPVRDHVSLWAVIQKRFGDAGVERIRTALRDAWITDADFDRIRAAGFNCVRLPFLYDLLSEPDGLRWLDLAIERAGKRGIYVILDMHGAPGRQSADHHTGQEGVNQLFKDPANVAEMARDWEMIARRYRTRPEVAGYDVMNEPMGAPNMDAVLAVYERVYPAIRAADSRHLLFLEDGYKGPDGFPVPSERGWQNVVYSTHTYQFHAKKEKDHLDAFNGLARQIAGLQERWNAPYYLGEFNLEPHGSAALMGAVIKILESHGWSWSPWTYKVVMSHPESSMWGLYRDPQAVTPLNPFTDSEADLLKKLDQVRTERLEEYPGMTAVYRVVGTSPP